MSPKFNRQGQTRLNGGWFLIICLIGITTFLFAFSATQSAIAESDAPPPDGAKYTAEQIMEMQLADQEPLQDLAKSALTPCVGGFAGIYPCSNIDLLAFLPASAMGNANLNDLWGWTDTASGREFAVVGMVNGTSFVEVTNPTAPVYLGRLPPHTSNSLWRDVDVYANHAFIGSEASNHGMQVFNLTQLLNVTNPPVVFSETAHYNGFGSSHTITINYSTGFAYAVGTTTCNGGLHFVNIQNPTSPTNAGCYSGDGYTHETQCVVYNGPDTQHQGKEICFANNEDTLTIVDVTNKNAPVLIKKQGYAGSGYTHQGWLTEDQTHYLLDDELDEPNFGHNTRTRVWDVTNLDAPVIIEVFDGPTTAIDHNQYVIGNFSYQANYRAGLRILDISNLTNLSEVAYFDVYPTSNSASFNGAWGNYPFFSSGIVLVSGIEQGLFVLQPNLGGGPTPTPSPTATGPTPTPTNTPVGPTPTPTKTPRGTVVPPTATPTAPAGSTMHVGDLDGSSVSGGTGWNATVTFTVHDASHNPVSGAVVTGSWSGGTTGTATCTTNASGQCSVTKTGIRNTVNSVTFSVTNVTKSGFSYQSGSNHDPDGDSTGTVIVVNKP